VDLEERTKDSIRDFLMKQFAHIVVGLAGRSVSLRVLRGKRLLRGDGTKCDKHEKAAPDHSGAAPNTLTSSVRQPDLDQIVVEHRPVP
jgi:hypothetical protein